MINIEKVKEILADSLPEHDAFLVDLKLSGANQIKLWVDKLEGIKLGELAAISRSIENSFDRDLEDFELEVTSPGVGEPLKVQQQYEQNVGRWLAVKTAAGESFEGQLTKFEDDSLTLEYSERVPKEKGKGKKKITVKKELPLAQLKEAKVQVRFK
jgi:ribosome maturation factor RimP